jgi:hypothetical protein
MVGVRADGSKELVALDEGYRESGKSWANLPALVAINLIYRPRRVAACPRARTPWALLGCDAIRAHNVWCLELSEAVPAPASWASLPEPVTHTPGRNLVIAVIPCEDPTTEPTVDFLRSAEDVSIPFEIMRWFLDLVAQDMQHSRAVFKVSGSETSAGSGEE